jgi:putative NIF3 family GTP cyclohydrolase 1 type 2
VRIEGIGRVGRFPAKMTLRACAELVKKAFEEDSVRVFGDLEQEVEVAAISPGSGKSVVEDAMISGAQVLITGDIDHHLGLDCVDQGLAIIDAGHYGIEKIFIPFMTKYLERELENEGISGVRIVSQPFRPPFHFV